MQRLTPYGISNFETIIDEQRYYVDKTHYIEKLEQFNFPVFLRPRRFGKSLFTDMLRAYYDKKMAPRFDALFGKLYIGKNPTHRRNSYYFLSLNFSGMGDWTEGNRNFAKQQFDQNCLQSISWFIYYYKAEFGVDDEFIAALKDDYRNNSAGALKVAINLVIAVQGKMYLVIDEYDSLTNAMAVFYQYASEEDNEYLNVLRKGGFFRAFFELVKAGTTTCIDRLFITGILPITLANMNSGFNIASWVTFDDSLVNMLGITESELDRLLDEVYADYGVTIIDKLQAKTILKEYYDGYHFRPEAENVYNPMMTMYFINSLLKNKLPDSLADTNLKIDYNQIAFLFGNNSTSRDEIICEITKSKEITHNKPVQVSFEMESYKEGKYIPEGLFHMGILTYGEYPESLVVPNLVTYEFVLGYFNRIMKFDSQMELSKITDAYIGRGDAEAFVGEFFRRVIQAFPGDFFKNANESYYHGLLFYVLWNSFAKDRYEVLPEYGVPSGRADIMMRTLPGARVRCTFSDLFEVKCLPKSAKNDALAQKMADAEEQMRGYLTGLYAHWRGICVVFRGNKDFRVKIISAGI